MSKANQTPKPGKLLYFIGRYPEISTTFIDRELAMLRQTTTFNIGTIAIRRPLTLAATLPEYEATRRETLYLTPTHWLTFFKANLYFLLRQPLTFLQLFFHLFLHEHPTLKDRLMTPFHFGLGVYAAYLLRQEDFDHIHVHFIDRAVVVAMVVAALLGKTYSLTAHANSIFVKRILIKEKIDRAAFMVTVSEHNKAFLRQNYPGLNPAKINILHPWVDVDRFLPPAERPPHPRFRILSVGRLVEKKGHLYLVEACHHLQAAGLNFECRIVGDGPLSHQLEATIKQYGLQDRVYLMGQQPQTEVMRLLREWADLFALPCVIAADGDRDGIPVSLAEAMAVELPVISTDIVGISELVVPGTGALTPPRDAVALAEAILNLQQQGAATWAKMGRQGRAKVEADFNLHAGTAQLADLFRAVLSHGD